MRGALLCLLLASTAFADDLIVRQRSSAGIGGPPPGDETVYLSGETIVTDNAASRTIVDMSARTITSADKSKRAYNVITFDRLRAQMEAFKKSLDQLPPESRKQMGALFEESGKPVTVKATGKTAQIAGHEAKEYAIAGGPYSGSIWVTDDVAVPPVFRKWKSLEGDNGGAARQLGDAMEKLEGFPLRTNIAVKAGAKAVTLSNEVLEIKSGKPPADMLKPPEGFTRVEPGAS